MNELFDISNKPDLSELKHFGVLGMKWGHRRARGPDGTVGSNKSANAAVKKERKKTSAARRHLSEGDLNKAISRLEKEKKLKELTANDVAPGRTNAKKILGQIGKATAATVGTAVAVYTVKAAMEQNGWHVKEAAKFIRPKK